MRVLDLFCGLKGWSEPFRERGHEILTLDFDPKFNPDICKDIMQCSAAEFGAVDVILVSPPCEGFSVMQIGRNWNVDHTPKTAKAVQSQELVAKALSLIEELHPKYFVIENPRAKLRKLPMMQHLYRSTVTYCQYGEQRMKPTDLWGKFPPSLHLKSICGNGDPCHISAPRGSRTGTQGMDRAESAKIPRLLALDFCLALERDLEAARAATV